MKDYNESSIGWAEAMRFMGIMEGFSMEGR
jgi:hypothetical protein